MLSPRPSLVEHEPSLPYDAAFNALTVAILVLEADRRVVYANRAAASLLQAADGLALVNSRLTVGLGAERDRLHGLFDRALAPGRGCSGGLMLVSRPSGRRPYVLHLSPIHRFGAPLAIAVISDSDTRSAESEGFLASLYGLTPAQARLARGLLDGETLETLSRRDAVSRNTLRAHLVQLFAKTDTHRQAELVCRLMRDLQLVSLIRGPAFLR